MSDRSDHPPLARRRAWGLLWSSLRAERVSLILGVVIGLGWAMAKVAIPRFAQMGIDRGIEQEDTGTLATFTVLIIVAGLVAATFTGGRRFLGFRMARRVEADLRHRLFAHLQRLHFGFHDQAQTGQLMSRANTDLHQIQFFITMVPVTFANAVTVVLVTVVLFVTDAGLAVVGLATLPFINVLARRFARRLHPATAALQQELAELSEVVEESVSGIRVVKGHGAEAMRGRRLRAEADSVFDRSVETAGIRATFLPAMELLPTLGLVAVLWFGGHQVLSGELTLGQLVAFNFYLLMLVWPLRSTGLIVALGQRAATAAERVQEVLATEPAIADRPGARGLPPAGASNGAPVPMGEVRFENVTFAYVGGAVAPVLEAFDLVVPAGASVAIVGATGSGKTTISRLVPRFYDVSGGRVSIDGVDVRDVRLTDLRRSVGMVFEDTFLFSDSVRANIAFADPDASLEAVERAARLSGAHDFVELLPEGYDTLVGERGFSLSGGQRQRIAIARAVLADPRVLILDDATSAVDPTKEHEIREALGEVMRGRTTIVIAHRPATIALADRVALLDGGRIVAEGTHDELLATDERYRQVLAAAGLGGAAGVAGDGLPVAEVPTR